MKKYSIILLFSITSILSTYSQTPNAGSFYVAGDENTYYPVGFVDAGWNNNEATLLKLGRSDVHTDKSWNGSLIATFEFHTARWGHGSSFVNADIAQHHPTSKHFIGGWKDATLTTSASHLIIWLRGAATYYYRSNYPQTPQFTSSNLTLSGITYNPKTGIDSYVNLGGLSLSGGIKVNSTISPSSFAGDVGIGTENPQAKLDVRGMISATEVKVQVLTGADHVFHESYDLKPLSEVEDFITENKHLPEIPSEKQMQEEGLSINEFQIKLLQKIEELTLYTIELRKEVDQLKTKSKN